MSATNLQVIKRSRHKPRSGELFAIQLPGGAFLFGRVIVSEFPPNDARAVLDDVVKQELNLIGFLRA
jgi:hypothetical protein